jgi:prepilin-type N-terminal cleavage/methylation domain-containing protein
MVRQQKTTEAGFTLVELAIVMIIIGLLIGGVLKGQALIGQAQITATIAQTKAYDAAMTTFRDQYGSIPGDMIAPTTRLPNCAAGSACALAGNGDGLMNKVGAVELPGTLPAGEGRAAFPQLAAAGLVTGVSSIAAYAPTWGVSFPEAKAGGGFTVSYQAGNALNVSSLETAVDTTAGTYLAYMALAGAMPSPGTGISPNQAAQFDRKLDDGIPTSGTVAGAGTATCGSAAGYAETNQGKTCGLYIKIQN